ncbi:MAG: hypothetical protein A2504_14395 [Bdellovibrionales bacterium RIFOXYD12_FULL_39_22]|nr:MAG: hypothetical protein A2385_04830 [Bdellovibrionales bacterium RIFOXYB1_FULL_39_21]OFZ43472.1 MAG: hypothetical protein A2485_13345 [Bdellovibrionales bacterium RIFOXYC12_FULL_39_17]OFZ47015.1 MAG: hypothetical protein A2404_00405 [Bdellovibrionales bacterium RIFOXYC1_FULL_39_130]OFZ73075.1 MAG: hypothetical protein A2451_08085 [Bdellovibrionales bacterium RIFOXYC2_FULL_39_8]OFZ76212.1 MAG: hypothetical protein A2560_07655 [Bdellovibrionales bacterium RIFOXYD1_FULL_39_84]OFZ94447.1 MAG:
MWIKTIDFFKRISPFYSYRRQSFTYYIPAPPQRSRGYREKQFDTIFYNFINRGFKIISSHIQPHHGEDQSGLWVMIIVEAINSAAEKLLLEEEITNNLFPEEIYHLEEEKENEGEHNHV